MTHTPNNRIVVMSQLALPMHANPAGNVHGGEIMKMMDNAAGVAGSRYARSNVVTARVDELMFLKPVLIGSLVTCTAQIVYVGNTTMEVLVTTEVESLTSDAPTEVALTAYFTIVSLDKNHQPKKVPSFTPDTEEEWQLYRDAEERRRIYREKLHRGQK